MKPFEAQKNDLLLVHTKKYLKSLKVSNKAVIVGIVGKTLGKKSIPLSNI